MGAEATINKTRVDMPPSRFIYLLQSSTELDNCKHANNLILICILYCFCFHQSKPFFFLQSVFLSISLYLWTSYVADASFTDYIKGLSPSTLDLELRMLQIIDDDDQQEHDKRPELVSIELLLDYFIHELSCRNDFEFLQAVIKLFLKVKGLVLLASLTVNRDFIQWG